MKFVRKATIGIIGAGPLGVELAVELKRNNLDFLHFDKGQVCQAIYDYPINAHFFSSSERIEIAGIPIQTPGQQKCSREIYLSYMRMVVGQYHLAINTFEEVTEIQITEEGFSLKTISNRGEQYYFVRFLVLATGGTSYPRQLNVSGENLPHVSAKLEDVHKYFQKKVAIIGGKNSAVEGALRCFHARASEIHIITTHANFDPSEVKYWLLPELLGCIRHHQIYAHYNSHVKKITSTQLFLENPIHSEVSIEADFVIKAIGFEANMDLFKRLFIPLSADQEVPEYDHLTMETKIPNVFALGTVIGGTQRKYRVFIENCHDHVYKILKCILFRLGKSYEKEKPQIRRSSDSLEE